MRTPGVSQSCPLRRHLQPTHILQGRLEKHLLYNIDEVLPRTCVGTHQVSYIRLNLDSMGLDISPPQEGTSMAKGHPSIVAWMRFNIPYLPQLEPKPQQSLPGSS